MMYNKFLFISAGFVCMSLLTSCSSFVNRSPDQNPPRLVSAEEQEQFGWDGGKQGYIMWDRPGAFGSVPDGLMATGNQLCKATGFTKVIGYHPQAIGLNGQAIAGGGFLCAGYRLKRDTNQ